MKCPRCSSELTHIRSQFTDDCADCGGSWYDHDELRRAKDAADRDLDWMDFEFWREEDGFSPSACAHPCPRCAGALVALEYDETGVQVDACPSCRGIWLDRGEFESIVSALEDEATSMTVSEYVRAALTEAREVVDGPDGRPSEWRDFKTVLRMLGLRLFVEKPRLVKTMLSIQKNSPIK